MSNNQSKPDGAHFSVRFLISHRAIKIAAIFIAVLILGSIAIPASSLETVKRGISLEPPIPDQEIDPDIFPAFPDTTVKMEVSDVMILGLRVVGERKYSWAVVSLDESLEDNPRDRRHLYIPVARMQSLFKLAMVKNRTMVVFAYPIEFPEGWLDTREYTLYKVTSAYLHYNPLVG